MPSIWKERELRLLDIDQHMAERDARLRGCTDSESVAEESRIRSLMMPGIGCKAGQKLGKRPVSNQGTLNQRIIAASPGSSRFYGLDFVKAVYSDRTGQEQEDWTREF